MPTIGFEHVCALIAFFTSVVFVIGYSVLAPWWHYQVGRAMVSLDIGLMLALLPGVLHIWFHVPVNTRFFAWYYCFSLLLVAGITLWRLAAIYSLQARARKQSEIQEEEELL